MQEQKQAGLLARMKWHPSFLVANTVIMCFLIIVGSSALLQIGRAHASSRVSSSNSGIMNAVVYDVTHNRYYTYYPSGLFTVASSMKVPIMLTFFDEIEREGRGITSYEWWLLTTMIENSNNNSASALYYGEIGGAVGVASYMQRLGITGLYPDPYAWGWSVIAPWTMVNLLTFLYEGHILTAYHRSLAFYLMEHVEADQRVGVGDTAPRGATVAMKDGWVPAPDGLWAMNSSGIVMVDGETYIIAVYTKDNSSLWAGQNTVRQLCSMVASMLR